LTAHRRPAAHIQNPGCLSLLNPRTKAVAANAARRLPERAFEVFIAFGQATFNELAVTLRPLTAFPAGADDSSCRRTEVAGCGIARPPRKVAPETASGQFRLLNRSVCSVSQSPTTRHVTW
jgi:hypothetical protein